MAILFFKFPFVGLEADLRPPFLDHRRGKMLWGVGCLTLVNVVCSGSGNMGRQTALSVIPRTVVVRLGEHSLSAAAKEAPSPSPSTLSRDQAVLAQEISAPPSRGFCCVGLGGLAAFRTSGRAEPTCVAERFQLLLSLGLHDCSMSDVLGGLNP